MLEFALSYPGASEHHPWGDVAVKVKTKAFVFMGGENEERFSMSAKLPNSSHAALMMHFAEPTGYGLGKAGWVTATFGPNEKPPLDLLKMWVDESYRAVAPKKLVATLAAPVKPVLKKKK